MIIDPSILDQLNYDAVYKHQPIEIRAAQADLDRLMWHMEANDGDEDYSQRT